MNITAVALSLVVVIFLGIIIGFLIRRLFIKSKNPHTPNVHGRSVQYMPTTKIDGINDPSVGFYCDTRSSDQKLYYVIGGRRYLVIGLSGSVYDACVVSPFGGRLVIELYQSDGNNVTSYLTKITKPPNHPKGLITVQKKLI